MNRHRVAIRFDSTDPTDRTPLDDARRAVEERTTIARKIAVFFLTRSNDARHAESGATSDGGRVRSSSRRDAESRAGAFDRARATRARGGGGGRARGTGEWRIKICIVASSIAIASTDRETRARDDRSIDRSRLGGIITETSTRARARCARDERTNATNERTNE